MESTANRPLNKQGEGENKPAIATSPRNYFDIELQATYRPPVETVDDELKRKNR